MEWVKRADGNYAADGFIIEHTRYDAGEHFSLFRTDRKGEMGMYAECSGSLEQCQEAAELLDPNKTIVEED